MNACLELGLYVVIPEEERSYTLEGPQIISHDAIILNRKKGQMIDKKACVI